MSGAGKPLGPVLRRRALRKPLPPARQVRGEEPRDGAPYRLNPRVLAVSNSSPLMGQFAEPPRRPRVPVSPIHEGHAMSLTGTIRTTTRRAQNAMTPATYAQGDMDILTK